MRVYDLKVLHMKSPVIDRTPEFSWKLDSSRKNVLQSAYRIVVQKGKEVLWDSRKILSRQQAFIPYEGKPLQSKTTYEWMVTVWDDKGVMAKAEDSFETALLESADWKAKWIEYPLNRKGAGQYAFGFSHPPILFKRRFYLGKKVAQARIYATSHGIYELSVNGENADDREFAPGFTSYDKILYYQTYDVTKLLEVGDNLLELYVGDGWYFSAQARLIMEEYHEEPSVLFQIEITYQDGTTDVIASDGTEECGESFLIYADLYQGEKQDYRVHETVWHPVKVKEYGYDFLCAQPMPSIYPAKTLPAENVFVTPAGEQIVDFGQIVAGRARVRIDVPKNQEVTLEYFEILDEKGNYINTMFAPQKDIVISDGSEILHEAKFTFHGFRYIRVTGMEEVRPEDFTAILLTTEKENKGSFHCSDERLNRLYQNVRWSQYNNMMSIPTDCPTREKAGWTGDILIYAKTAMLNEEMTPFLNSWLRILRSGQQNNGVIQIVAPRMKVYEYFVLPTVRKFGDEEMTGVAGWSDAVVWVPYEMYQVTGNRLILRENFDAMEKWCEYIIQTAREKRGELDIPYEWDQYLWNTGFHFGEWLVPSRPDNTGEEYGICKESAFYTAPFFGYMTLKKMTEICEILGEKAKSEQYRQTTEQMKQAIQNGILRAGLLPDYLMGAYVLAFAFDLVPTDLQEVYQERLKGLIREHNGCLDTGFLATPFLLDTLWKIGEQDLALEVLWQDQCPSWLYEVDHGATAIWEAWDADEAKSTGRIVSFDHYAFGCVDDWICRHVAGIDSDTPGFSHIVIKPDAPGRLTSCDRTFLCEAGEIRVSWDQNSLSVKIPCNTTATVEWNGKKIEIGSGTYLFEK